MGSVSAKYGRNCRRACEFYAQYWSVMGVICYSFCKFDEQENFLNTRMHLFSLEKILLEVTEWTFLLSSCKDQRKMCSNSLQPQRLKSYMETLKHYSFKTVVFLGNPSDRSQFFNLFFLLYWFTSLYLLAKGTFLYVYFLS